MDAGRKFGRPSKLNDHQRRQMLQMLNDGKTQKEVSLIFGCDQSTVSYQLAKMS